MLVAVPAQVVAPVADTTGPGKIDTETVPVPVHPATLVPVTVYVVVAEGETEILDPFPPVLHA
ncbi:hypothetical protein SDC9_144392 [bioreactor metagenome]|uniref:Uncharacterized protein n=1 Tax=bioreactor metagenome TaxID=1076179 RepID=A0A645E6Q3_9ZZZZ